MKKWRCVICDYVYDPALGDPDASIPPQTAFEALPDDWLCPICGVGKDQFEVIEQPSRGALYKGDGHEMFFEIGRYWTDMIDFLKKHL